MPIIKQAIKKMRVDRTRSQRNKKVEAAIARAVKLARKSPTAKNLTQAFSMIDRGVKAKIVHKNKSARLKSRLSKLLKK